MCNNMCSVCNVCNILHVTDLYHSIHSFICSVCIIMSLTHRPIQETRYGEIRSAPSFNSMEVPVRYVCVHVYGNHVCMCMDSLVPRPYFHIKLQGWEIGARYPGS